LVSKRRVERKKGNLRRKGRIFEEFYVGEKLFDKTKNTHS
jgi:hypothetical protein